MTVNADIRLLEQALVNVIDNATKYSFPRSTISISAGVAPDSGFFIVVANTGIPMTAADIEDSKNRGWRGQLAARVTPACQGLGLWIARSVAAAHGGHLDIVPTDSNGRTQVRLVLPTTQ